MDEDAPFTIGELRMALDKTGQAAPGKDEINYVMIKHLSKRGLVKWPMLYNKVWKEGKMPKSWKGAVIKPIIKTR